MRVICVEFARLIGALTVAVLLALGSADVFAADSLSSANAALQAGKADEATGLLNAALKADPSNAEANNLMCRVELTLDQFDAASGHCEKAVNSSPNNARYHMWFGRALGERAAHASFMSAFSLARRTRAEFETAVRLDPRDTDALGDLAEFYEEAPGAVGGGLDKADGIAVKMDAVDAARGHEVHADIAEKRKDLGTAEREFKAALTGSTHPAHQWMQLAGFYRRHERWAEMESAIHNGEAATAKDKHSAVALFDGASILVRANRQPEQAIKLLVAYVASPDKTEEAPAFEALTRLSKLRRKAGDAAGADRDRAAALALAHDYKPAQEANQPGK